MSSLRLIEDTSEIVDVLHEVKGASNEAIHVCFGCFLVCDFAMFPFSFVTATGLSHVDAPNQESSMNANPYKAAALELDLGLQGRQPNKQAATKPVTTKPVMTDASRSLTQSPEVAVARRCARRGRHERRHNAVNWAMLPTMNFAEANETAEPVNALEELLHRLATDGVVCPGRPKGVYADIATGEYRFRLYAVTDAAVTDEYSDDKASDDRTHDPASGSVSGSAFSSVEVTPNLWLILKPLANSYLPIGTQLIMQEASLLNSEPVLRWATSPTCLYTQVYGNWQEKFTVDVWLPTAGKISLPPLMFASVGDC